MVACGGFGCWNETTGMVGISGDWCADMDASNGLAMYLDMAAAGADATIAAGSSIDATTGMITGSPAIPTAIVNGVRVFYARSLVVGDVTLVAPGGAPGAATPAVAFVTSGPINVLGTITATGTVGAPAAPGASLCQPDARGRARGGSGATGGGPAGVSEVQPLVGGCDGTTSVDSENDNNVARGGGGGGAIQLVSRTSVTVQASARINVGGGGGGGGGVFYGGGGGGGGGNVLIEAPVVTLAERSIIAANGGGGGACDGGGGRTATASTTQAPGGTSGSIVSGGAGAAGSVTTGGSGRVGTDCRTGAIGGGGGGLGTVHVRTRVGGLTSAGVVSAAVGTGSLRMRRRQ